MTEAANVEQKASGARIKPSTWVCDDCGNTCEQQVRPIGCTPCESLSARRSETPIQPGNGGDWRPQYGYDALVELVAETLVRTGHERRYAEARAVEIVAEVTND